MSNETATQEKTTGSALYAVMVDALREADEATRAEIFNEAVCDVADEVALAIANHDYLRVIFLQHTAIIDYITKSPESAKAYLTDKHYRHIFSVVEGRNPSWGDDIDAGVAGLTGEQIRSYLTYEGVM